MGTDELKARRTQFYRYAVVPSDPMQCWGWSGGSFSNRGYPVVQVRRQRVKASRLSWMIHHGAAFPVGMNACHSCDNPGCVNPNHIFPGTQKDNIQDCVAKGRHRHVPRKQFCKRGHELTAENTIARPKRGRSCIACRKLRNAADCRATYQRRKARLSASTESNEGGME